MYRPAQRWEHKTSDSIFSERDRSIRVDVWLEPSIEKLGKETEGLKLDGFIGVKVILVEGSELDDAKHQLYCPRDVLPVRWIQEGM